MDALSTRQAESRRLASHLAATVSYLWIKSLLTIMLGALLGASLLAERPRPPHQRADRRPGRSQPRAGGLFSAVLVGGGGERR